MNIQPTLQEGDLLIRPLKEEDYAALWSIASDPQLWEQHPAKERATPEGFKQWFSEAKTALVLEWKGEVIGTSRFRLLHYDAAAVEIGWTFLKRELWGKGVNARVKHRMLAYAFEHYEQVLFFVDVNNFRSQQAVQKIGARRIHTWKGAKLEDRPTGGAVFCLDRSDFKVHPF